MSKFNLLRRRAPATTYEGAPGFARGTKSELFLLAVSNMAGEHTFYESAEKRDERYTALVRKATLEDPGWTARLLRWLRTDANMRSASLVGAAEFTKARLEAGLPGLSRQVVDSVLQRADEPGEFLAYWTAVYGRALPKPVKRGVADAAKRLYNERSFLKYDGNVGFRFGDVLNLTHPETADARQSDLFGYALDVRHGNAGEIPASLRTLGARAALLSTPVETRREVLDGEDSRERLARAGMTWESLSGWLQGPMDAKAWESIIPSMGYMALLRNLRNLDEAGVSDEVAEAVCRRLADPAQVATSRQFPFRFLSAYEQAPSLRWAKALDVALGHSLQGVPALTGRSLILIDTSASMSDRPFSARSKVTPAKAAAVFGIALGAKGVNVDVHGFASGVFHHKIRRGSSVIREVERFVSRIGEVGHGTDIAEALRKTYAGHDRVFVISDMQTIGDGEVHAAVPPGVPLYGFNLGGYRHGAYATGTGDRHEFGGLTDATFRMVPLLETGQREGWPF